VTSFIANYFRFLFKEGNVANVANLFKPVKYLASACV